MLKKRYKRDYIILDSKDQMFRLNEKQGLKGFAKVEIKDTKGSLLVFVENLKYIKDGYRVILIQDDLNVKDIGRILVNENGKGEFNHNFIDDKFSLKAIALTSGDKIPFIGFKGKKLDNYADIIKQNQEIKKDEEKIDIETKIKEVKIKPKQINDKSELEINTNAQDLQQKNIADSSTRNIEDEIEELDERYNYEEDAEDCDYEEYEDDSDDGYDEEDIDDDGEDCDYEEYEDDSDDGYDEEDVDDDGEDCDYEEYEDDSDDGYDEEDVDDDGEDCDYEEYEDDSDDGDYDEDIDDDAEDCDYEEYEDDSDDGDCYEDIDDDANDCDYEEYEDDSEYINKDVLSYKQEYMQCNCPKCQAERNQIYEDDTHENYEGYHEYEYTVNCIENNNGECNCRDREHIKKNDFINKKLKRRAVSSNDKLESSISTSFKAKKKERASLKSKEKLRRAQEQEICNKALNEQDSVERVYLIPRKIKKVLTKYKQVKPFNAYTDDTKWWKIDSTPVTTCGYNIPYMGYMNYINYTIYSDTTYLCYRYRHYIFGIRYSEEGKRKYYIYGIPGLRSEQPDSGETGFNKFVPCDENENMYGYWLCYLDCKSRLIAFCE